MSTNTNTNIVAKLDVLELTPDTRAHDLTEDQISKLYTSKPEFAEIVDEEVSWLKDSQISEMYDDMLDKSYGNVEIAGFTYSTSQALYRIDRIAYDTGLDNYYSYLLEDQYIEINGYLHNREELMQVLERYIDSLQVEDTSASNQEDK